MKAIGILIFPVVLLLSGCGVREFPRNHATAPGLDYGPETVTYYNYNTGAWVAIYREIYTYNSEALITRISYQFFDGSNWGPLEASADYLYNRQGQLDHILGAQDCRYQYDAFGRLEVFEEPCFCAQPYGLPAQLLYDAVSRVTREYNAFEPFFFDWSWTYRTDDRVEAMYWNPAYRAVYVYDGSGRLEESDSETLDSGVWDVYRRTRYTYDIDGCILERVEEEYVSSVWYPSYRYCYSYGADGKLVSIIEEQWNGSPWELVSKREFTYTSTGSSITFEQQYPEPIRQWIFDYYGQGEVNRYVDGKAK